MAQPAVLQAQQQFFPYFYWNPYAFQNPALMPFNYLQSPAVSLATTSSSSATSSAPSLVVPTTSTTLPFPGLFPPVPLSFPSLNPTSTTSTTLSTGLTGTAPTAMTLASAVPSSSLTPSVSPSNTTSSGATTTVPLPSLSSVPHSTTWKKFNFSSPQIQEFFETNFPTEASLVEINHTQLKALCMIAQVDSAEVFRFRRRIQNKFYQKCSRERRRVNELKKAFNKDSESKSSSSFVSDDVTSEASVEDNA